MCNLSEREMQVLILVAYEFSNKEIATILSLSANTIDSYRRRLFAKFKVKNSAGLIRVAFDMGYLPVSVEYKIKKNVTISELLEERKKK